MIDVQRMISWLLHKMFIRQCVGRASVFVSSVHLHPQALYDHIQSWQVPSLRFMIKIIHELFSCSCTWPQASIVLALIDQANVITAFQLVCGILIEHVRPYLPIVPQTKRVEAMTCRCK